MQGRALVCLFVVVRMYLFVRQCLFVFLFVSVLIYIYVSVCVSEYKCLCICQCEHVIRKREGVGGQDKK